MKIKNKLSLLFTLLAATILMVFATLLYFSTSHDREIEFYKSLKREALTKANLFFNAKVNARTLQTIYLNNREILNEVETAIYDTAFVLLYHDAANIDIVKEDKRMIEEIRLKKQIEFYQNNWQVVGLEYKYESKNYIIVAAAYDQYGYRKLQNLGKTMLFVFIFSIIFIYAAGRFFSKKALAPIVKMNDKAKTITATHLDLRIDTKGRDELAELADTFNEMLDRLEQSFEAQKDFVSNISHELRTPLSIIITELELSRSKDRSVEEYKKIIQACLDDAQRLAKLANSLLDFAKASYDTSTITFKEVRLDEILLDAQHDVIKFNKGFNISIAYENETEEETVILGNEYLLKTAFINLMENACKFSMDKHCKVIIALKNRHIILKFSDNGIGIEKNDIEHVFLPFYRGQNKEFSQGNGIGLSLTAKIIALHGGKISVSSIPKVGSVFTIEL